MRRHRGGGKNVKLLGTFFWMPIFAAPMYNSKIEQCQKLKCLLQPIRYLILPQPITLNQAPIPSPTVSTFTSKAPHPNNEAASLFCNFNDMTDASGCCSTAASAVLSLERFLRFRRSAVLFRCQQGCVFFLERMSPWQK